MPNQSLEEQRYTISVIGMHIDSFTWEKVLSRLAGWVVAHESRYVCICNAHSVVTGRKDMAFAKIINGADMATPDGAPVAWLMSRIGNLCQERINGPDLMWRYCQEAAQRSESIYLYGGKPETLSILQNRLRKRFTGLNIAGAHSPPYRQLTSDEDNAVVEAINTSGAGTVWVSLGCPKQEKWMADHRGRINAVMIGVGAAFDYHAGTLKRAPFWMQRNGLEWFYRLYSEPSRLWKRYLVTNCLFIFYGIRQLLQLGKHPKKNSIHSRY